MAFYKLTRADGSQETVSLERIEEDVDAQLRYSAKTPAYPFNDGTNSAGQPALGTKRLPQVGEVWRNRANALVAILSQATVLNGGYNVVPLTKGDWSRSPGATYLIDLDGGVYGGSKGDSRPGDLVSFATRFDS